MNRRDLMRFFAAGTVIAPLGGVVAAKLIEVPKIEPVTLSPIIDPRQIKGFSVNLEMMDGTARTLPCSWPRVSAYSGPMAGVVEVEVAISTAIVQSPVVLNPIVRMWGQANA